MEGIMDYLKKFGVDYNSVEKCGIGRNCPNPKCDYAATNEYYKWVARIKGFCPKDLLPEADQSDILNMFSLGIIVIGCPDCDTLFWFHLRNLAVLIEYYKITK